MKHQTDVLVEMHHIQKMYSGVHALNDVSLSLRKGEILGLIGENGAGKSTLMKILIGVEQPDGGEILYKGMPYAVANTQAALSQGIAMIHQELSLIPSMTVSENIWLGRENLFCKCGLINRKLLTEKTKELLQGLNIPLNPDVLCSAISVANQQLTEIVRAFSYNPDVIIMDEPTSALTDIETEKLFQIMKSLAAQGKGIIFISHKLSELLTISDRITVLKDGQYVDTLETKDTNEAQLIQKMVGRPIHDLFPKVDAEIKDVVMEVQGATRLGVFADISFQVHRGEILGFCGLMGAGRTEIMEALVGLSSLDSGGILLDGKKVTIGSPNDAIRNGIVMVTEDRLHAGLIHCLSVGMNLSLSYLRKLIRGLFINKKKEREKNNEFIGKLNIKVSGPQQLAGLLSGGNQQKVILGKCLMTEPNVLILDEPTRGIDVAAKSEIYKIIGQLAQEGKAILLVSSELPELMGISDRILVIRHGRITGSCVRGEFDESVLMSYAFDEAHNGKE